MACLLKTTPGLSSSNEMISQWLSATPYNHQYIASNKERTVLYAQERNPEKNGWHSQQQQQQQQQQYYKKIV